MKKNVRSAWTRMAKTGLAFIVGGTPASATVPKTDKNSVPDGLDRSVLPIKEPSYPIVTELDARNAKAPARFNVKAPANAPNVVVVLLDDIGFGHSSAFGGPIHMPNLERLAANGLRYNRFHTTALSSPTRTALLTGYNHHSNNAGAIMEVATAFPGNTGIRPQTITPAAQVLRMNGYNTAAFGKYHETPPWEGSVSGPYDRWPTGSGFEKFYGFIGGETNQWHPMIYDGTTRVFPDVEAPGYHFTTDMTNQAIRWMNTQQSLTPDNPFYMYFAPGPPTRRTTCRNHSLKNTKANSTRGGTSCGRKRWRVKKSWASSPKTHDWHRNRPTSKIGRCCPRMKNASSRDRWKCSPGLPNTRTWKWGG
jgi:arylsulfatase A-like enzyme